MDNWYWLPIINFYGIISGILLGAIVTDPKWRKYTYHYKIPTLLFTTFLILFWPVGIPFLFIWDKKHSNG